MYRSEELAEVERINVPMSAFDVELAAIINGTAIQENRRSPSEEQEEASWEAFRLEALRDSTPEELESARRLAAERMRRFDSDAIDWAQLEFLSTTQREL